MRGALLVVAALLGAACGPTDDPSSAVARQAITGGQEDRGDPQVFMLDYRVLGLPTMCSATLIGARTLITAAHCTLPSLNPGAAGTYRATNALHARSSSATYLDVTTVLTHPGYAAGGRFDSANDVALVLLRTAPPGVAPKPWNRATLAGHLGEPVRVAGYGYTVEDDYTTWGTKNVVDLTVAAVSTAFLSVGDQVARGFCNGDSGGPTFLTFADGVERVVGVHSNGATCAFGDDVRVDRHAGFIDDWMRQHEPSGSCAADGACVPGCTPPDPDCVCARDDVCRTDCPNLLDDPDCPRDCVPNGVCATARCPSPDVDCVAVGDACSGPLACRSRLCLDDGASGAYCSAPCGADADCPAGLHCEDAACRRGSAVPPEPPDAGASGELPHGAPPTFAADLDAVSLRGRASCSAGVGPPLGWALILLRRRRR